jgi:glutamine synthetase
MATDDGQNLLEPGKTPHDNLQFLLFLSAVITAVDDYADLLRASAASAGNDHRLGANEAPPAIVSIFLGEQLTDILEQIEAGGASKSKLSSMINLGTNRLPSLPKDTTDRNRTSPFAFTGNKFEFRMVGSMQTIARANYILNTIVAESLSQIADRLEKAANLKNEINAVVLDTVKKHKKIFFNGNNYAEEWVIEAEKRGLPNVRNTVDAIGALTAKKNIDVLSKHKVLSKIEVESRAEIQYETYIKTVNIEGLTMVEMSKRQILPAVIRCKTEMAAAIGAISDIGGDATVEKELFNKISESVKKFSANLAKLEKAIETASKMHGNAKKQAAAYRDLVFKAMAELRKDGDMLETMVDADYWPLPTYSKLLFKV